MKRAPEPVDVPIVREAAPQKKEPIGFRAAQSLLALPVGRGLCVCKERGPDSYERDTWPGDNQYSSRSALFNVMHILRAARPEFAFEFVKLAGKNPDRPDLYIVRTK